MNTNSRRALIGFTLMMSLLLGLGLISLLDLPGWRVQASHGSPGNQAVRPRAAKAAAAAMLAPMSTITVNSTADGDPVNNGACTLREAMMNATGANQSGSTDCVAGSAASNTITFNLPAGPQTINLTWPLPGIFRGLTIIGPGAGLLTVQRDSSPGGYRIFNIPVGGLDIGIYGLTINNGFANTLSDGGGQGGGIRSLSNLTLGDCVLTGNQALYGGGVYLEAAEGVFTGCTFSFNTSYNTGGAITFEDDAFEKNTLRLNNCTISNNFGSGGGGGIYFNSNTLEVTNCTIADNTQNNNQVSGILTNSGTTRLRNTIIANNNLIGSIISLGNNLASDAGGGFLNQPSDKINTDPLLSPLGSYGGATPTRALLPGSPAINAGNNCVLTNTCPSNNLGFNLTTDQRGAGFNRQVGSAVDIGAFESRGFSLAVASGNNQSAVLNGAFTNPLSVRVTASGAGEPVNGGRVTFTPPASGASATIAGNPATISSGLATTGTVTANATGGAYTVAANAIGATAAVNFALTNISNTAPTFTPVGAITRQRGSAPGAAVVVGTVADSQTAAGSLTVTQIAGGTATGIIVSGITNTNGTIRALLSANCTATSGTVRFQVSDGALTGTGNLQVNVQSNTAPTVGSYPLSNATPSVLPGGNTVVTPSSPPSDNGTVTSVTATAAGFSGTLSGNPATGAITITNANPPGLYTVNVTLTDNCGATTQRTFRVVVNTPPTIQASAVTRQKGSPASNSQVATVQDAEDAENTLTVRVEGAVTATKNGVTVSNLAVNAAGQVTAGVVADCTASNASFTLTVFDFRGASATATLNVTVTANTAPVLTYDNSINRTVASGGSLSISPATGPSDNVTISSIVVQNQSTYTGTISVNAAGVVSISNVKPIGIFAITIRATDNCGATTDATIVLRVICPTITLAPAALPNGTTGASYNATITAGGGATPHTFTTSAGALPNGLSLSSGGVLSGTPNVANTFSFTVKATDASGCTGMLAYTVTINSANNPPTISASAVSQQQGSPAGNPTIANVNDPNQALNTLAVTVNGGASATVNGITVSGISVSASGAVTANVVAACTATNASFTLTVTDTTGATASATLNVTVTANTAPVLTYTNRTVASGGSLSISPATGPSDNGTLGSVVLQSQGTYTGTISVSAAGVVSISDAKPSGVHTITIRATDNCNAPTDAAFTLMVSATAPTTTITNAASLSGTPTVIGQAYAVNVSVSATPPSTGTPTGTVTVSDGSQTCTITLPATSCDLTGTTVGAKTITATYNGDADFGTSSATASHTVNKAETTTSIVSDNPDSSAVGQSVTVVFTVTATAPGAGTPSGNVVVTASGGAETCTGTVAAGSCVLALTTPGARTLTATYAGDTNFNGSSDTESHAVIAPPIIAKAFVPASAPVNSTTTLTLTITNPASNPIALTGLGFTDTFPAGLMVATPLVVNNTCGGALTNDSNGALTAGSTGIRLSGGSVGASPINTCTVSVNVTPTTAGPFNNVTGNVSSTNGGTGNTASATLLTNTAPAISSNTIARQTGSSAASFTIATAADPDQSVNTLSITINGNPTSASSNGVTVSGVTITPSGAVTANISTTCAATTATFALVVTDNENATGTGTLTIDVQPNQPPVLSYANQTVTAGTTPVFMPAAGPSDNGTITSLSLQSVTPNNGGLTVSVDSATGQLQVTGATLGGSYAVVIGLKDNCDATATATLTITVDCPAISTQPASQNVGGGQSVTFSVTATGNGLGYQWRKNGSDISGATGSDYTIASVVAADAGNYDVVVTGICGSVTSSIAVLTVNTGGCAKPVVSITGPASGAIYAVGTPVNFTGAFTDSSGGTHIATWTFDAITQSSVVNEEAGTVSGSYTFTQAGVYQVTLAVSNSCGEQGTASLIGGLTAMVVVYDPSAGFVTGNGWIVSPEGAYPANPSLTGNATFGFVSKYKKGNNVPTGDTEFQFALANLGFKSTSYEWLVVSGVRAQYKGSGTINGTGDYRFILTAIDGKLNGDGGQDKFRIRIWNNQGGGLVYDNQLNDPDSADPTTVIGGGQIVIRTNGNGNGNNQAALAAQAADEINGEGQPREAEVEWQIIHGDEGGQQSVLRGGSGAPYFDLIAPGDYDGDGQPDLAIFRRANGHWLIKRSTDGGLTQLHWGFGADLPVAADYDGDGKTDIAVWRGATGQWFILRSSDGAKQVIVWGAGLAPFKDQPAPADYDGDGKADVAVWRAAEGKWYALGSASNSVLTKTGEPPATAIRQ